MTDGAFDFQSRRALAAAFTSARELSHSCLCSEHILLGILSNPDDGAARALEGRGITLPLLRREIEGRGGRGGDVGYTAEISREAAAVLEGAAGISSREGKSHITPSHILLAILGDETCRANALLRTVGADMAALNAALTRPPQATQRKKPKEGRLLAQYGVDMTRRAAEGRYDPLIGRQEQLDRVIRALCRRRKANPVLLGEAGVGKTAIAEGLAAALAGGRVPPPIRDMRLISVDMASMVSGTKYRGEFEEKARGIIEEASGGDIILFIDELHTVAGAGAAEGAIDAGNILKPALARGDIRILGATTPAEYKRHIARDGALERRFLPIDVPETGREETMNILKSAALSCRRHYGIEAGEDVLGDIELMCRRFLPSRRFPDKAIDVLDEASALAMTQGSPAIGPCHIRQVVGQMSGLTTLDGRGGISPAGLEGELLAHVVGQREAVREAVYAAASAMAFPGGRGRPGAMLFYGPSGCGKTLLARCLARGLFGSEDHLIRFDMSEYREAHSISRLIGSPPGYAGYGSGGLLTDAIGRRPFSVVLFDEVEKAHPEVLNLLLQLLEEGRLTDSEGRTADFRNAIVIMTSNAGGRGRAVGFGQNGEGTGLEGSFPPELLSRIDRLIPFSPLTAEGLARVAEMELDRLAQRLKEEGIELVWDSDGARALCIGASQGREVRGRVDSLVRQPLALMCLEGERPERVELKMGEKGVEIVPRRGLRSF